MDPNDSKLDAAIALADRPHLETLQCNNDSRYVDPPPYNRYQDEIQQAKTAERFVRLLKGWNKVQVSGGPFHNIMRSSTYGETYDEAPWRVRLGIADIKDRSGVDDNPMRCRYENRVLVNNWLEERRDRQLVKYDNTPKLSEYSDHYKTEYSCAYTKRMCNKARETMLKIKSFPMTAYPGHQPDLDLPVVNLSSPKPEGCIIDEELDRDRFEARRC